jgi:hypothetical protein
LKAIQTPQAHKHQRGDGQAHERTHQRALEQVAQPERERHLVEAEALLDAEGGPPGEWQPDQATDQRKRGQQAELLHHATTERREQGLVQPVESAQ